MCVSLRGYRHDPDERATEIKAATYHDLSLEKQDGIYIARVIFDL
jgi:SHS2 domain-containing protein